LPQVEDTLGVLCSPSIDEDQDWLCPKCIESGVEIISMIIDKRLSPRTQYIAVFNKGQSSEETLWQDFASLQQYPAAKELINAYNKSHRKNKNKINCYLSKRKYLKSNTSKIHMIIFRINFEICI